MIVIFLDFDGVLNSHNSFVYRRLVDRDPKYFVSSPDMISVTLLDYLLFITGAKIVVSSSWRHGSVEDIQKTLKEEFGLVRVNRVIDQTPRLNRVNRGTEIQHWLDRNPVDNYIILDDESDMLDSQMLNLVKTNFTYGFGVNELHKALDHFGFSEKELQLFNNEAAMDKFKAGVDSYA